MTSTPNSWLATCQMVARLGGEVLMEYQSHFETREKAPADLVTDADFASQQVIHDALSKVYPEHHFLGEEKLDLAMMSNEDSEFRWIVDPLDGTLNYVHRLQSFSVSIALQHRGRIIAATVFDPWLNELFSTEENGQATLNGHPIHVSDCQELNRALAVVSLPPTLHDKSPELEDLHKLLFNARSVRRLGSAALNLCYLAAGRLDVYWATTLKTWDVAAGYLILKQAGGIMTGLNGETLNLEQPEFVAASSQVLNEEVRRLLADG